MNRYSAIPSVALFVYGLLSSSLWPSTVASNVPCSPRAGDEGQGQICVCNSTYCDTIERPARLPQGHYYRYSTSNSTPGFSQTNGTFSAEDIAEDNDVVFTVNASVLLQEIIGFGGSFSDSVCIVLNSLPQDAQDKLVESYFGPTGLEYTLGRVPIGGSDFSPRIYTLDDVPEDETLQYFSLSDEDYNYKIPLIKKAMNASVRGIKVYACAWNSPSWMKTNHNVSSGYVLAKYHSAWAKYHIKFLEAYKYNGLNLWAFSINNEPLLPFFLTGFKGGMWGVIITADTQRDWIKNYLIPELKASNVSDMKLLALDDIRAFGKYLLKRFSSDPDVYELVEGVGLHWYGDWTSPPIILDNLHKEFPDKLIVYTESSINYNLFGGNPVELGSWKRASGYIYNIMENINHMTNGYIDWNLALNTEGGPFLFLPLDAAIIVNETSGEFYKQPMFYGIGHFSKFIPPGSRRVKVTSNQNDTSPIGHGHAALGMSHHFQNHNPRNSSSGLLPMVTVPSTVLCLATTNSDESNTIIVLNSKNVTVRVRIEDSRVGSVSLDLEANSVNTFVYWL